MHKVVFLEFNEISFDAVQSYCASGRLPHLAAFIEERGWSNTQSESRYEDLEPWIQWVTAHTGLTLGEHGVFRLGDIVGKDLPQIWEQLEECGFRVGAVSPMNAKHRLRAPAFFVPDPWTPTAITAPLRLQALFEAVVQAVNDNAQARLAPRSVLALLSGFTAYAAPANWSRYVSLAAGSLSGHWRRALFLDLLLADVFIKEAARTEPHFASLFLNAGAHIQHHYMFASAAYRGELRNPAWYSPPGRDPVLEAYELYDHILGSVRAAFPSARVMIATGLRQVPHKEVTFYWRLKKHAEFLRMIGVSFLRVEPRMSRDFLVVCRTTDEARRAEGLLSAARGVDGERLFDVDNRGLDLFVMLTYPRDVGSGFRFSAGGRWFDDLREHIAFVALKNGEHDGTGYFLDSAAPKASLPASFPLTQIPDRIFEALGARRPSTTGTAKLLHSETSPVRVGV